MPVALGPEEAEEVRFQAARLAYLWGSAAAAGVEAPLARERAEYWLWRLDKARPSLRDFTDLRHGFQVRRQREAARVVLGLQLCAAVQRLPEASRACKVAGCAFSECLPACLPSCLSACLPAFAHPPGV